MARQVIYIVLGLILFTGLLFFVFPEIQFSDDKWMRYTSLILILGYLILSWNRKRVEMSMIMRSIFVWGAIAIILMTGYSFRHELSDLKANLLPASGREVSHNEMRFEMADDGHYYVLAEIHGKPIRFMVDTGASRVVLSPADAKRLGYDASTLAFNAQSSTANGTVWSALIRIESLKIGNQVVEDIPASVSQSDLGVSLLGMSFLNKLRGYQVERGAITFRF